METTGVSTMATVGSYEAKTHFSALIERVMDGEQITITKHNVPVARLVPAEGAKVRPVAEVIKELRRFRADKSLAGDTIREMLEEGRR
jgi:prevent-host-death family protein